VRTAVLGRDGPTITRLGIGGFQAAGSGPWGWGPDADDEAVIAAIRHAVELGITWVDTAPGYGLGHSEEVVARALAPWRVGEEVLIFTKCAHPWDPPDRIRTDLRPDSIRRECEGSLRRLGVERLDLLQIHHPDPGTPVEDSWGAMAGLVDAGKVRWIGVSNFDVELLDRCEAIRHVDSLQPELSMLLPGARDDVIPWCRAHGTGVLVYSPQGSGLLSGGYDRERIAAADEVKRGGASVEAVAAFVDRLRPAAERLGLELGALAVAWTLAVDGVTGAICGARRPSQVDGWIAAWDVVLDAEDLAEIAAVAAATGIGGHG
jgi:aryl-alcohol dehydrogenase-like predicted oxidoreductase